MSALPVCDTGRLGELVRFTLRQAGAPEVWPGWAAALHHAHADVWADRFRAGQAVEEVHPDPALPAAMVTITAALASCEPVSATEPTYQAALVFEVRAELPDYRAGAPTPASVEADPGASSALRTAQQTLRTGSITFTLAPGMVDYDNAAPREAPLYADLSSGPVNLADQGADVGARTTTAAPPAAPAPPTASELLAVASRPADAGAEFTSLRAELEAGLGRPLNSPELAQLTGLAIARAAALERLERQRQLRALYDAELAALQAQRDAALDAEVYEQPSFLDELGTEAWEGGPVRVVRDIGRGFEALVERSGELQREAIERGDYRGAAFAAPAAIVEQTVQTFGGISDNLRMTSDAIERVLSGRRTTDQVIAGTEAVLGIGMAMLQAWSIVEPVASKRRGGGAAGGAKLGLVEAGAGSRAGQIAAAGAAVAEGSLARPAIVLTIARLADDEPLDLVDQLDPDRRTGLADDAADEVADDIADDVIDESELPPRHRDLADAHEGGLTVRNHSDARQSGIVSEPGALNTEQHHVFPKESAHVDFFKQRGLDANKIHDYCIDINEQLHQLIHVGRDVWDREWSAAIIKAITEREGDIGRLLTVDEMKGVARELMDRWGVPSDTPFRRWEGAPKTKAPPPKPKRRRRR